MQRWCLLLAALMSLASGPPARAGDDEAAGTLLVQARDAQGRALGDARIAVWNAADIWTARTDPSGRARMGSLPPGRVQVYVAAWRHTAAETHNVVIRADQEATVEVTLGPGIPFEGRVLGPEGEPVVDAYVELQAGGTFAGYSEAFPARAPYARERTGRDGRFRVGGIPRSRVGTLVVTADRYEVARVSVRAVGEEVRPAPLVIRLAVGARLVGVVTNPDGAPLAGASVYVIPAGDGTLLRNPRLWWTSSDGTTLRAIVVRTDARGRYVATGLAVGTAYRASATAEAHARSAWSRSLVPTSARPSMRMNLALRRPAALVVRLTNETGLPVNTACVRLGDEVGGVVRKGSPGDGAYRFTGLTPGEYELHVECEDYVRVTLNVDVKPGESRDLGTVALDRGLELMGRVVDAAGKPVSGARVTHARYTEATTGEDGAFALEHIPRSTCQLEVAAEGFLTRNVSLDPTVTTGCGVVVLQRGALLRGIVEDEAGHPLEDSLLQVQRPATDQPEKWTQDESFGTDEEGRYEIRVAAGRCRIAFVRERGKPATVLAVLDAVEGETRTLDLSLSAK